MTGDDVPRLGSGLRPRHLSESQTYRRYDEPGYEVDAQQFSMGLRGKHHNQYRNRESRHLSQQRDRQNHQYHREHRHHSETRTGEI